MATTPVSLDNNTEQPPEGGNGQFVRVEGSMVNPESKDPSPAFRVTSIQPLAQP